MKSLILVSAIMLSGCATGAFKNTEVLVQKDYIVRTAPDSLKKLPPLPAAITNPKTATNTQVARWINSSEEYAANLEAMISTLINFYEKPVTPAEAANLKKP